MQVFLEETVNHYNSNNRSAGSAGGCAYIPLEGVQSEGCAIGRKLPKSYKKKINRDGPSGFNFGNVGVLFIALGTPRYFKGMPLAFLERVQLLHDGDSNWNIFGLRNKNALNNIIDEFGLKPIHLDDRKEHIKKIIKLKESINK